jgi:hypothetical protein
MSELQQVCTFDSPCLTFLVSGVQPSFGFQPANTNHFGIPAQLGDTIELVGVCLSGFRYSNWHISHGWRLWILLIQLEEFDSLDFMISILR